MSGNGRGAGEMADESQRGYKERNWLAQGWVPEWSALGQFLKRGHTEPYSPGTSLNNKCLELMGSTEHITSHLWCQSHTDSLLFFTLATSLLLLLLLAKSLQSAQLCETS